MTTQVNEEKPVEETVTEQGGKHPETVPWNQYVGIKESLGRKVEATEKKMVSLEEQLKAAVKPEEHATLKKELEELRTNFQKVNTELSGIKEKSIQEQLSILVEKGGFTKEEVTKMSEDARQVALRLLDRNKPKADLGSGGGSPITQSAKQAIRSGFDALHPNDK